MEKIRLNDPMLPKRTTESESHRGGPCRSWSSRRLAKSQSRPGAASTHVRAYACVAPISCLRRPLFDDLAATHDDHDAVHFCTATLRSRTMNRARHLTLGFREAAGLAPERKRRPQTWLRPLPVRPDPLRALWRPRCAQYPHKGCRSSAGALERYDSNPVQWVPSTISEGSEHKSHYKRAPPRNSDGLLPVQRKKACRKFAASL